MDIKARSELPLSWNPQVDALVCLRCQCSFAVDDIFTGCPRCLAEGFPASLALRYRRHQRPAAGETLTGFCHRARLPYSVAPSLGEGRTPTIELAVLAAELGLEALQLKDERANPTGSHKDRATAQLVARALDLGRTTVVAASSGNAGQSLAAYAAYAGLSAVVVTLRGIRPYWRRAIEGFGARLVEVEDQLSGWGWVAEQVEREGWYPATNFLSPPVGSNPFAVQGYKTIAYELADSLNEIPDAKLPTVIVVPCSRGDVLWGIWAGLRELADDGLLKILPRLVAVEPYPRLVRVLQGEDYRQRFAGESPHMPSIGGPTVAWQAICALEESGGCAVAVDTSEAMDAQRLLEKLGIWVELSSATALAALPLLIRGKLLGPEDRVMLLATSHGDKDGIQDL